MRSRNVSIAFLAMFVVIAIVFGIVIWSDFSLPAKIAFFACGFGAGIFAGQLIVRRA